MTTIEEKNIKSVATPLEIGDRLSPTPASRPSSNKQAGISIIQYDPALTSIIGPSPTHALLLSSLDASANAFFHRGCVYIPSRKELWTTSAPLAATDPTRPPTILMSKVNVEPSKTNDMLAVKWAKMRPPPTMPMPAGGCLVGEGVAVWCSQGNMASQTGGVLMMQAGRHPQRVASGYYGHDFNSPHSAAVSPLDNGIWFTDPCCGHEQDFRARPQLPPQVYRCEPKTGEVRAMADGFKRPTGIAIDEEFETVYVADAGGVRVDGSLDLTEPRSIYAFDIVKRSGSVFLANRRLFALARRGAPMHLMCENGNVWAACSDGIEIWSNGGSLLGAILVPGGVMSFCRGADDTVFICAEQRLWRLQLSGDHSVASPELL
ncbi:hypothetical protein CLIM01_10107 [Colletotrichum limetticola]|uniref:SMP-30/Gluconolactonase/LRE-like region domain-containing protein n=1 Tax=Colletotrichum limetticola TaxID=1209924 RepID=A0ABQ9PKT0_9PEZI|nr:hypothetical protein CLIM01_10107 [Colletotrichum limetticola]